MASINKVILIGNLGRDPELRYSPDGVAFCTISLATTRTWKSRETGERQDETEWHRVVFNDKLAEVVGEYCKKGRPLYVEGRLRTRKWTDKEGKDVYTTEIIGREIQLLGGRDSGDGDAAPASREERAPARGRGYGHAEDNRTGRAPARPPAPNRRPAGSAPPSNFDDMDDDIPFLNQAGSVDAGQSKQRRMRRSRF